MKAVPGLRFGNVLSLLLFSSLPTPFLANFETMPKINSDMQLIECLSPLVVGKDNFLCVLCAFAVKLF